MPSTVYVELGKKNRITLREFIDALKNLLGVLEDLDSTISREQRGSITWEVSFLQKESPPVVGITGVPRRPVVVDISESVEKQLFENAILLNRSAERNQFFSDSALNRLKHVAAKTKRLGPITVYTNREQERREAVISETTLQNVQQLTGVKYSAFGSISGSLDSITVHRHDEFRIWDENTGKPVRCKFDRAYEDKIKDALRSKVVVSGIIHANNFGFPISIDVEDVQPVSREAKPTIKEMSGLVDDFTEGKSLRDYLKDVDNE